MALDESFCLTQEQLAEWQQRQAARLPAKRTPRAKSPLPYNRGKTFVTVPYPGILTVAVQVGGVVLGVLLSIMYATWQEGSTTIKLRSAELERAGIDRQARRRALLRLAQAGAVEVSRPAGIAPRVTLIWPSP